MHFLVQVVLLLVAVAAVAGVARRNDWSAPILLVLVGLAVSAIPGVPIYRLDPEIVLVLVLPPLVHSAAIRASLTGSRRPRAAARRQRRLERLEQLLGAEEVRRASRIGSGRRPRPGS